MYSLIQRGQAVVVNGLGWTYVYVTHGENTSGEAHHVRIPRESGLCASDLLDRKAQLEYATAIYHFESGTTIRSCLDESVFVVGENCRLITVAERPMD